LKQNRTLIGIAAVLALAVLGVVLLTRSEPQTPTGAPTGAMVAVPPEPVVEPPAEAGPANATSEPAPAEAQAEVPTSSEAPSPEPQAAETQAPEPQTPAQAAETQAPGVAVPAQVATAPKAAEAGPEVQRVAPKIEAILPSFDVVRVERSGEAVIAGRAAPGSEVTLRVGNRVLGKVTADRRGQWVLVLESPLGPGSYELSLESRLPGGEVLLSVNVVVVSVPRPQIADAESVVPRQPEVAAQPESVAEAPAPGQPGLQQSAPTAPEQPAPGVAATEADSATQIAQDTQTAQVSVAEPAAATPSPEPSASRAEPAATAPQVVTALAAEAERPLAVLMPRSGEGQIRVLQQAESDRGGLGEGTLVLETVDYDALGRTRVGGRAEAGSRLVVYLDNRAAAHAEAAVSGHWEATLVKPIAPGLHTLRIDQLANDGQVTARVETPFSRAAVLTALPSESAVIVQPGNSLWRISRRVYGEGLRFSVIYQANRDQIGDPDLIYPGQIFVVPTTD